MLNSILIKHHTPHHTTHPLPQGTPSLPHSTALYPPFSYLPSRIPLFLSPSFYLPSLIFYILLQFSLSYYGLSLPLISLLFTSLYPLCPSLYMLPHPIHFYDTLLPSPSPSPPFSLLLLLSPFLSYSTLSPTSLSSFSPPFLPPSLPLLYLPVKSIRLSTLLLLVLFCTYTPLTVRSLSVLP
jgi:hypothetical protein